MDQTYQTYLLSIPGLLAPKTLEAARAIHNSTAGAPANVAIAKSLGDLSHMVYVPVPGSDLSKNNFLILDLWNNPDGLNQFFANPQVQHQAGEIFEQRDPVVWTPAPGLYSYHIPAPYGMNNRILGVVRGTSLLREKALDCHNTLIAKQINTARAAGNMSHEAYFRLTPPGTSPSLEFFAVDTWMRDSDMEEYYNNPDFISGFQEMFSSRPDTSVWIHPSGDWVEW